ncbi:MAG: rod shape-determining protein MreD [Thermoanaerobaculia bacterium]
MEVPLVLSLYYLLSKDTKPSAGLFFSTFSGLLSDYLYGYPIGLYGFSNTLTTYITYHLYNKLYIQSKLFYFFIFFLSHSINALFFYILIKLFHISILRNLLLSFIISSLLGAIILTVLLKKR